MIRRVVDDVGLDLSGLDGLDVRPSGDLDPAPWAAHEVLVVTADAHRLAEAGALGLNRLLATEAVTMAATVVELCRELDRP